MGSQEEDFKNSANQKIQLALAAKRFDESAPQSQQLWMISTKFGQILCHKGVEIPKDLGIILEIVDTWREDLDTMIFTQMGPDYNCYSQGKNSNFHIALFVCLMIYLFVCPSSVPIYHHDHAHPSLSSFYLT